MSGSSATTAQEGSGAAPIEAAEYQQTVLGIEENEKPLAPEELIGQQRDQKKDEAGLAESSKAIVAAILNQDNLDETDAALMIGEDEIMN